MGGRALLQAGIETKRIDRDSFYKLYDELEPKLQTIYNKVQLIPFYRTKETFGDMDILVSEPKEDLGIRGANDFRLLFQKLFNPKAIIHNGNVWSFDQDNFQVDIIKTKPKYWDTTLTYYSYNDLGNLMGRIARRLGFRYGHYGLKGVYKSKYGFNDYEFFISDDIPKIFEFLGFYYDEFKLGFDTLEDIFEYVIDSDYFDPNIFAYENLDHTNRVRNKKRDSYQKFIEYISVDNFEVSEFEGKDYHFERARIMFGEDLKNQIETFKVYDEQLNKIRQKFNGNIVMDITKLQGKELGEFISLFKNNIPNNFNSFNQYILETDEEQIKKDIKIFSEK